MPQIGIPGTVAILALVCSMASTVAEAQVEVLPEGSQLSLSEESGLLIAQFGYLNSTVALEAAASPDGHVGVELLVNSLPIDVSYDPLAGRIHLDGYDGAISLEERRALRALVRVLEDRWKPYTGSMSVERHLAFRTILLLSEAPVGYPLTERVIEARDGFPPNVESAVPYLLQGGEYQPSWRASPLLSEASTCEVDGGDGISQISCQKHTGSASHDACPDHGMVPLTEILGCSFDTACLGRCGAGCGFEGAGVYTQDCADHDSCCRIHGGCVDPFDDLCGDEYSEAADDFLVGSNNCNGCKNVAITPPPPSPSPCSSGYEVTSTFVIADSEGPMSSPRQLEHKLERAVERPEGHYLMEEWAIVNTVRGASTVVAASTEEFGSLAVRLSDPLPRTNSRSGNTLVVEAGIHPMGTRWMPLPSVPPVQGYLQEPVLPGGGEAWFRAEVDETGSIERLRILNSSDRSFEPELTELLTKGLSIHYVDERRHRVVVFGYTNVASDRRVTTSDLLVVLPQCCCGDDEPFCV